MTTSFTIDERICSNFSNFNTFDRFALGERGSEVVVGMVAVVVTVLLFVDVVVVIVEVLVVVLPSLCRRLRGLGEGIIVQRAQ